MSFDKMIVKLDEVIEVMKGDAPIDMQPNVQARNRSDQRARGKISDILFRYLNFALENGDCNCGTHLFIFFLFFDRVVL